MRLGDGQMVGVVAWLLKAGRLISAGAGPSLTSSNGLLPAKSEYSKDLSIAEFVSILSLSAYQIPTGSYY